MKEVKKFFHKDFLNKGYDNSSKSYDNPKQKYSNLYKQYRDILPSLDILEQYEEHQPGFIKQFIGYMQKKFDLDHAIRTQSLKNFSGFITGKLEIIFLSMLVNVIIVLYVKGNIFFSLLLSTVSIFLYLTYLLVLSFKYSNKLYQAVIKTEWKKDSAK